MTNIKIGVAIANLNELSVSVNGERVHDYTMYFTTIFKEAILKIVKHTNWLVYFGQIDEIEPSFGIDIYADLEDDYKNIHNTIFANLPKDVKFEFLGRFKTYTDYIQTKHR